MFRKLIESRMTVAFLWIAFLFFGFYLFNFSQYPKLVEMTNGLEPPEQVFGASWDYQSMFVERLGETGRALYANFQLLDYINATLLGLVFFTTIYQILKKLNAARPFFVIVLLPLLTAGFDVIENTLMYLNLRGAPQLGRGLSEAFAFTTKAKLALGTGTFLAFVVSIVAFFLSAILRRSK